jgi:hypothetical protein
VATSLTVLTVHAHVAGFGHHFFSAGHAQRVSTYRENSLNDMRLFVRKKDTFCHKQRSSQWVDPSRRVILGAVMEILNDIRLDASLRDTVELNGP